MRVAENHPVGLPAAKSHELMQRCACHDVPRCPGVPQVVPAKVRDLRLVQRELPESTLDLPKRLAGLGEYELVMETAARVEHRQRLRIWAMRINVFLMSIMRCHGAASG